MKRIFFIMTIPFFATLGFAEEPASENAGSIDIFAKHLAPDRSVLEKHPDLAKAYEDRNRRIAVAMESCLKRMEALLDREKRKADLKTVTQMEKGVEAVRKYHQGPCLLNEWQSGLLAPTLKDLNQEKSRANKRFLMLVDREIAKTLRNEGTEAAKKIERFTLSVFVPKSLEWSMDRVPRRENKIYLRIEEAKEWQDAYDWCRERNGELVSIHSKAEQQFLFTTVCKGPKPFSWTGGVRVDRKWFWSDGTPMTFTSWTPSQPSMDGTETRVTFAWGEEGDWDDQNPDGARIPFIIQWTLY